MEPRRTPPHAEKAEEYILACLFIDGAETLVAGAAAGINADSFFCPKNRLIYQTAEKLMIAGKLIASETIAQELFKNGLLETVGGVGRLSEITDTMPTTAHRDYFLEEVRTAQACREVIRICSSAIETAHKFKGSPQELCGEVSTTLAQYSNPEGQQQHIGQIADQVEKDVTAEIAGKKSRGVIPTGIPTFDRVCGLFEPGEVIVLGARPSIGKTSLALGVALRTAQMEMKTLFFSLEMKPDQLVRIAAGQISGIAQRGIERAHPEDQRQFFAALRKIRELRALRIFGKHYGLHHIIGTARAESIKGKVALIVVDYVQLIELPRSEGHMNREQVVATISRSLKKLAVDLDASLLVLAQLNRSVESEKRQPRKADLRESGAVEQDADRVMLLHRPSERRDGSDQPDDTDVVDTKLIVDKHRGGPTGEFWLSFRRPAQMFQELAQTPSETP